MSSSNHSIKINNGYRLIGQPDNHPSNTPPVSLSLRCILPSLFILAVLTFATLIYAINDGEMTLPTQWIKPSISTVPCNDQSNDRSLSLQSAPSPFSLELNNYWKPLPEIRARAICGHWQPAYQSMHQAVSSGQYFLDKFIQTGEIPPPPVLVFQVNNQAKTGGISDRWPILSTAMVVSLLTNRMIYFDWPGYEAAYDHPNLPWLHNTTVQHVYSHWRFYTDRLEELRQIREHNANIMKSTDPSINRTMREYPHSPHLSALAAKGVVIEDKFILPSRTHDFKLLFSGVREDVRIDAIQSVDALKRMYGPDRPIAYLAAALGGKGLTRLFWENGNLRDDLTRMGLKHELCHGCLINFVLGLNDRVKSMFDPFARQLLARDTLTVGLQIRMGDWAMKGQDGADEKIKHDLAWQSDPNQLSNFLMKWFRCAGQLVEMYRNSYDQPIIFFLVSDDVKLRKFIKTQYRPPITMNYTLLTIPTDGDGAFAIGHTDIGDRSIYDPKSQLKMSDADRYLQVAAGEQWLLAYCDFWAIDQTASGFGRSAVLRSLTLKNAFDGRHANDCQNEKAHLTLEEWYQIGHKY